MAPVAAVVKKYNPLALATRAVDSFAKPVAQAVMSVEPVAKAVDRVSAFSDKHPGLTRTAKLATLGTAAFAVNNPLTLGVAAATGVGLGAVGAADAAIFAAYRGTTQVSKELKVISSQRADFGYVPAVGSRGVVDQTMLRNAGRGLLQGAGEFGVSSVRDAATFIPGKFGGRVNAVLDRVESRLGNASSLLDRVDSIAGQFGVNALQTGLNRAQAARSNIEQYGFGRPLSGSSQPAFSLTSGEPVRTTGFAAIRSGVKNWFLNPGTVVVAHGQVRNDPNVRVTLEDGVESRNAFAASGGFHYREPGQDSWSQSPRGSYFVSNEPVVPEPGFTLPQAGFEQAATRSRGGDFGQSL